MQLYDYSVTSLCSVHPSYSTEAVCTIMDYIIFGILCLLRVYFKEFELLKLGHFPLIYILHMLSFRNSADILYASLIISFFNTL